MPKSSATIITMKNIEANTANSMVALPLSSDFSRFMKSFFIFIALLEQHHFGAAAAAHAGADRRSGAATLHRDRIRNEHETAPRSEEHTSELQSIMRISYAVFCLKQTNKQN